MESLNEVGGAVGAQGAYGPAGGGVQMQHFSGSKFPYVPQGGMSFARLGGPGFNGAQFPVSSFPNMGQVPASQFPNMGQDHFTYMLSQIQNDIRVLNTNGNTQFAGLEQ